MAKADTAPQKKNALRAKVANQAGINRALARLVRGSTSGSSASSDKPTNNARPRSLLRQLADMTSFASVLLSV